MTENDILNLLLWQSKPPQIFSLLWYITRKPIVDNYLIIFYQLVSSLIYGQQRNVGPPWQ